MEKRRNKNRDGDNIKCSHCNTIKHYSKMKKCMYYIGSYSSICKSCNYEKYGDKRYNSNKDKVYMRGKIYILECNRLYKIGKTIQNIKSRISVLQIGNPYKISLIKEYKTNYMNYDEHSLHKNFIKDKFMGEWFKLGKKDLQYIDEYFKRNK